MERGRYERDKKDRKRDMVGEKGRKGDIGGKEIATPR